MPIVLDVETQETKKPVLLLFGNNPIISLCVDTFKNAARIAIVKEDALSDSEKEYAYKIRPESTYLLSQLEEKIHYAVLFALSEKDIKVVTEIVRSIEKHQGKIILLVPARELETLVKYLKGFIDSNIIICLLGDLFGKTIPVSFSPVSKLIHDATVNKKAYFTGDDLSSIYPISSSDALSALNTILFSSQKSSETYYLFYRHPQTIISAVHLIRRHEIDLSIEFLEKQNTNTAKTLGEIEMLLFNNGISKPSFLDEDMAGFEKSIVEKNASTIKNIYEQDNKIKNHPKANMRLKSFLVTISTALIFYTAIIFLCAFLANVFIKQSIALIEKNNINEATSNIKIAELFLSPIHSLGKIAKSTVLLQSSFIPKRLLLADSVSQFIHSYYTLTIDSQLFLQDTSLINLQKILANITDAYLTAEKLMQENSISSMEKLVNSTNSKLVSIMAALPIALGYDREKSYLLLFQNNGELRPTGGFIGSIGELKILKGKVVNFEIKDVYDLDGQLKAHIEPHFVIRRYLQPHLYLRDSNFSLDFQKNASLSALLYQIESGKKVDGVIGVDFEVIKKIIEAVGPIELSKYNKTIDESNAFDFLQTTIDSNFFPGSVEKKQVLKSLLDSIILKIESKKNLQLKLLSLLPTLMDEKHLLFAFNSNSIQSIFSANNLSGEILEPGIKNGSNLFDFFGVNEANIGANKANITIARSVEYEAFIQEDSLESKITLNLYNSGPKSLDYKVFLRFIVPKDSQFISIRIDGKDKNTIPAITNFKIYESKSFKPSSEVELITEDQASYKTYGFVTTIAKETTGKIEILYTSPSSKGQQNLFIYSLLSIKQPGTNEYPLTVKLHLQDKYKAEEIEGATIKNGTVIIEDKIVSDKKYNMKLSKQN